MDLGSLSRREFVVFGGAASLALIAGCSSDVPGGARSGDGVSSVTIDPSRRADVAATYRAEPLELDLAGRVVQTAGYSAKVPGDVLRATAGDLVEVTLVNALAEATSVHWHGLAILNSMDGVPGLTQGDIEPDTSFTYRFVVPDAGTYWFHPHHGLQLDRGLMAPLIVEDPAEPLAADVEYTLVLDDWLDGTGTTPDEELAALRDMGGMSMDSMGAMSMATSALLGGDAGDVEYPYHLVNGRPIEDPATLLPAPRAGQRVRLRIINAGADTAYRFAVGGHRMTVTHSDGFPVEPVVVDAILIGMGERYDITIDIQSGAWPVVALAEGKDSTAGAIIRTGDVITSATPDLGRPLPEHDGVWLRYSDLRATEAAGLELPASSDIRELPLRLTGGMMRYDWGIDGRPYGEHEPIEVAHGEWVRLAIRNDSMMWHPVHLHGHTPQLSSQRFGARKDTVNVLPGQSVDLTFQADNPGSWMLHCHNAYHLESGMATVVTYTA